MDLKVIEKKEEPLLSRTKITSQLNFDAGTPSEKDVKSKLASSLNSNENLIVIKSIYTNFGFRKADVIAYLYKDEKEMESTGIKPKKKEKKPEEQESKKAEKSKEKAQPEEAKEQEPQDTKASNEEKPKEQKTTKEKPKE